MSPKVIIVTGASRGLGAAIASHLLAHAHKLVLAARSPEPLACLKSAHPAQVEYVAGDMTDAQMPARLVALAVKAFGRLDGLVLNHGLLVSQKFASLSAQEFNNIYDVNVFSCVAMAQEAIPELRKTNGCILWVSSGAARKAYQGWSAYASSKAAINSVSTCIAFEEKDITSLTIEPGRVDTDMQALIRSHGKDTMDKTQFDDFVDAFDQGQLLKPEQPGNVMARFVANPTKELSGQNLKCVALLPANFPFPPVCITDETARWNSPELVSYQDE
ncbi:hypothetical protein E4U53_004361 [Claviceps sorghi]|nr:hypothetical protein E4U53_004361 [Claviceps sorghi]